VSDALVTLLRTALGPPPAGATLPLKVGVISGPDEGREALLGASLEVGTDAGCGLVIRGDPSISRKHLLVSVIEGGIIVRDLNSKNGTYFAGSRLQEAEIPLGAVLRLGQTEIAVQARTHTREVGPSDARSFGDLVGESVAMREVFALLERAATTDVTLLIEGESGTGKARCARSLHEASPRRAGPFVVFDCAAVPSDRVERELFGDTKGALGAFQQADGGTLCLDEIGELDLDVQPKLLRAIETHEVRAVGSNGSRAVDVRLIATTNRDLHAECKRGRFRSDLYYRLEVVRARLPPLRRRPEDIPGLIEKLLSGKLPPNDEIGGKNLRKLMAYGWPGNVRELRNALLRALTLAERPHAPPPTFDELVLNLGPAATAPLTLGAELPGASTDVPYKEAKEQLLQTFDRIYVSQTLARHKGDVTKAAAAAGLSRKHLSDLIKKLDLATDEG
jgi:DNA-binding NtrC family response regulator